jgi:hypothetical protein
MREVSLCFYVLFILLCLLILNTINKRILKMSKVIKLF